MQSIGDIGNVRKYYNIRILLRILLIILVNTTIHPKYCQINDQVLKLEQLSVVITYILQWNAKCITNKMRAERDFYPQL